VQTHLYLLLIAPVVIAVVTVVCGQKIHKSVRLSVLAACLIFGVALVSAYQFAQNRRTALKGTMYSSFQRGDMSTALKAAVNRAAYSNVLDADISSGRAESLHDIGYVLKGMGYCTEAIEYFEQARKLYAQSEGPRSASVAKTIDNEGTCFEGPAAIKKSISLGEEALSIYKGLQGPNGIDVQISSVNLARRYVKANECEKGLSLAEAVLNSAQNIPPDARLAALDARARGLICLGKSSQAITDLERVASEGVKLHSGEFIPDTSVEELVTAYIKTGDMDKAKTRIHEYLSSCESHSRALSDTCTKISDHLQEIAYADIRPSLSPPVVAMADEYFRSQQVFERRILFERLAASFSKEILPVLAEAVYARDSSIRARAAFALSSFPAEAGAKKGALIKGFSSDPDYFAGYAALFALWSAGVGIDDISLESATRFLSARYSGYLGEGAAILANHSNTAIRSLAQETLLAASSHKPWYLEEYESIYTPQRLAANQSLSSRSWLLIVFEIFS
jgi:hypothetical protein